jgi:hypothetical protein
MGKQLGEGAVFAVRRSVAAWLVMVCLATPALGAAGGALPWEGGAARVTPLEARGSRVARSLAGPDASVECASPADWRSLAAEYGFDRELTWALTPLRWDGDSGTTIPTARSTFSPRGCRLEDAFSRAPTERGARLCRHGAALGECNDWGAKLLAVHVLGHESMHLAGVIDEAQADCFAAQLDAIVAVGLGAEPGFARSLAREYWAYYYPTQDRRYRSAECRDGRKLDLFPSRRGWPTPDTYPLSVARSIHRFVVAARASSSPDSDSP